MLSINAFQGSGKTYTIGGGLEFVDTFDDETSGIIPRAIAQIFDTIKVKRFLSFRSRAVRGDRGDSCVFIKNCQQ